MFFLILIASPFLVPCSRSAREQPLLCDDDDPRSRQPRPGDHWSTVPPLHPLQHLLGQRGDRVSQRPGDVLHLLGLEACLSSLSPFQLHFSRLRAPRPVRVVPGVPRRGWPVATPVVSRGVPTAAAPPASQRADLPAPFTAASEARTLLARRCAHTRRTCRRRGRARRHSPAAPLVPAARRRYCRRGAHAPGCAAPATWSRRAASLRVPQGCIASGAPTRAGAPPRGRPTHRNTRWSLVKPGRSGRRSARDLDAPRPVVPQVTDGEARSPPPVFQRWIRTMELPGTSGRSRQTAVSSTGGMQIRRAGRDLVAKRRCRTDPGCPGMTTPRSTGVEQCGRAWPGRHPARPGNGLTARAGSGYRDSSPCPVAPRCGAGSRSYAPGGSRSSARRVPGNRRSRSSPCLPSAAA